MMRIFSVFAGIGLLMATSAAIAQSPMSASEFDAYTRGKTLTYSQGGQTYGAEQYKEGHQVIWAFSEDECKKGRWSEPEPGLICFRYEDRPETRQCWNFYKTPDGLKAIYEGSDEASALYEAEQSKGPLLCLGPKVGA